MSGRKSRKPAPDKGRERTTKLDVRLDGLPPEALEALAAAPNRSGLMREALVAYVRAGPEREALARLESKIDAISARLAVLEAGGFVPAVGAGVPVGEVVPDDDALKQAKDSFSAWCDD